MMTVKAIRITKYFLGFEQMEVGLDSFTSLTRNPNHPTAVYFLATDDIAMFVSNAPSGQIEDRGRQHAAKGLISYFKGRSGCVALMTKYSNPGQLKQGVHALLNNEEVPDSGGHYILGVKPDLFDRIWEEACSERKDPPKERSGMKCGIDLGTTYSVISWYDDLNERLVTVGLNCEDGSCTLRSAVYYPAPGKGAVVGTAALNSMKLHPEQVVVGMKQSMGRNGWVFSPREGEEYTPVQVSSEILKVLIKEAEGCVGGKLEEVVITVPAYFEETQKNATIEAAVLAGIPQENVRLLGEPQAAALAKYIDDALSIDDEYFVVYDLGGGTFDVVLVHVVAEQTGEVRRLKVDTLIKAGNAQLGGLLWDEKLGDLVAEKILAESGNDPRNDAQDNAVLLENAEIGKKALSRTSPTVVIGDHQLHQAEITRAEFEDVTSDLLFETEQLLEQVLDDAEAQHQVPRDRIQILLAGGSSRMPMVAEMVERVTGKPPLKHGNPDLLVSMGAAYRAYVGSEANAASDEPQNIMCDHELWDAEGTLAEPEFAVDGPNVTSDANSVEQDAIADRSNHMDTRSPPASSHDGSCIQSVDSRHSVTGRGCFHFFQRLRCDAVDCTVFAPPKVKKGDSIMVQVFAHIPKDVRKAVTAATMFDEDAKKRGVSSLATRIKRGSTLAFDLVMPDLDVRDPVKQMTWKRRPTSIQFEAIVPRHLEKETVVGQVLVSQEQIPIGEICFKLQIDIAQHTRLESNGLVPCGTACRYSHAFISYASGDRSEVLKRTALLKSVGIHYFQDILNLQPGDEWWPKICHWIDQSDVFLLFWSSNARNSDWVEKEWRHALRRGVSGFIRPVIIEGPPVIEPPPELGHLHFSDSNILMME